MDTVFIEDLRIRTLIGINDWERQVHQVVRIDLEMAWDNRPAARSESINDCLDYRAVARRLRHDISQSRCELVETLAERCATVLMEEFKVPWLRLRVSKPGAVRGAANVGVVIERGTRS